MKPRFDVYSNVSAQIREIFAEHTPLIEPLSLDEAYLDVTENLQGIATATEIATLIRARIKEVTGLNASAGISYNKFLAKLASDHRKPNGQFVITPRTGPAFVETLPVGKFHGIGPATAAKMQGLGIHTGADMRGKELAFLRQHFGKAGTYYYWVSRGIDNRPVRPDRVRKSVGGESTFSTDLTSLDEARAALGTIIDKVWLHYDAHGTRGRTITLKVKICRLSDSDTEPEQYCAGRLQGRTRSSKLRSARAVLSGNQSHPSFGCIDLVPERRRATDSASDEFIVVTGAATGSVEEDEAPVAAAAIGAYSRLISSL